MVKKKEIIFLHGFLGAPSDWDEVIACLGRSAEALQLSPSVDDFFYETRFRPPFYLVGYSMGGRFALQFAAKYPGRVKKLILISTHLGLTSKDERKERIAKDELLAEALLKNRDQFIEKWYETPLFASLKKKKNIVEMRKNVNAPYFASLLQSMSLGKQPCFVGNLPKGTLCIIGELDESYRALYQDTPHQVIQNAGHAIHLEEPKSLARAIFRAFYEDFELFEAGSSRNS